MNVFGDNSGSVGKISDGAGAFDNFQSSNVVNGTKEFLESNSLVAKTAFLILVVIVFVLGLRLFSTIVSWMFSINQDPYLVKGLVDAKKFQKIAQNPDETGSITLLRSDNEEGGIEFTYSVWLFIDDLVYNQGRYKHIFHKGNDAISTGGMNEPNNAPGLYIAPDTNALVVVMNTFSDINEKITIENIPINKWVNVQIRVENHNLDVFINGKLAKRLVMNGVPKQNYGDVYVAMNGGFSGYISNLRYFNEALGTTAIDGIVDTGPNLKMGEGGTSISENKPNYLSMRWFFHGV
jgi:hypothetical protein